MFRLLASLRTGPIDSHQIVKNAKYFDILKDHTGDWPAPVRILPLFQFPVIYRIYTNCVFIFPASICQAPVIWWHLIIIEPPVSAIKMSPASIKGWVSAEMVAMASSQQWRYSVPVSWNHLTIICININWRHKLVLWRWMTHLQGVPKYFLLLSIPEKALRELSKRILTEWWRFERKINKYRTWMGRQIDFLSSCQLNSSVVGRSATKYKPYLRVLNLGVL